jgi:coatomer subunit beta
MDALIDPIYSHCLSHVEPYVRRNAVSCLFEIYSKYGEELLEGIKDKLLDLLENEMDINTKRNALVFLFKVDKKEALNYLSENIEDEDVHSFGDILQLVIIRNLIKLCQSDDSNKGKYMVLLIEFMKSKHESVVFELSMNMISLTRSDGLLRAAIDQLIRVFLGCSDMNVKLVILEKLEEYKKIKLSFLTKSLVKLFSIFTKENVSVKKKGLKLVENLVDDKNVNDFLKMLKEQLIWSVNAKIEKTLLEKYQKKLLRLLANITEPRPLSSKFSMQPKFLEELLKIILVQKMEDTFAVSNYAKKILTNLVDFEEDLGIQASKIIKKNITIIKNQEISKMCFSLYASLMSQPKEAKEFLNLKLNILNGYTIVNSRIKKTKKVEENKESKADEIIRKVIILEDGTYGTELVKASSLENENKEGKENFDSIIESLGQDNLFLVNFLRQLMRLLSLLDAKDRKQTSLVVMRKTLEIYKILKKIAKVDRFVFTELNKLITQIKQLNAGVGSELVLKGMAKRKKKQRPLQTESEETVQETAQKLSEFDDLLGFRGLKGRAKADAYFDDGELFLKNFDSAAQDQKKVTSKLKNMVQLTGYSDPIYSECTFKFTKYNIDLEVFMLNRTDSILKNVNINFFSSVNMKGLQNLRLLEKVKLPYLMPGESTSIYKSLKYNVNKEFQFFGDISFENNAGTPMGNIRTNNINFNILEFLEAHKISTRRFRHLWQVCDWENKIKLKTKCKDVLQFIESMKKKLSLSEVRNLRIEHSVYCTFSMYSRFCLGKDLLINFCFEKSSNGFEGYIRLRSQNMGLVVLIGKILRQIV